MPHHEGKTGTKDSTYDLVSVLYHALAGADTYEQYIKDAEQAGENDLAQFFRDVQSEDRRRADRAKQLLAQYLGQAGGTMGQRRAA